MPVTLPRFRPLTIAVAIGVVALLVILYWISAHSVHEPPASLQPLTAFNPPQPAPDVAFTGVDGARHTLGEFHGRLVVLNLWAPWCAPCVKELPALAALQSALSEQQFAVVAVDVGHRDTPATAKEFLAQHGAKSFKAYTDSNAAMLRTFGAYGLPVSILIDGEGRQIGRALGPADWSAPESVAYLKWLSER